MGRAAYFRSAMQCSNHGNAAIMLYAREEPKEHSDRKAERFRSNIGGSDDADSFGAKTALQ